MSGIVLATTREGFRVEVMGPIVREGLAVWSVADWEGLVRALTGPARLVLVDAEMPGKKAELLGSLLGSLPRPPVVRSVGGPLPGMEEVAAAERTVLRLAHRVLGRRGLDADERRMLSCQGLGRSPLERIAPMASSQLPILIHGERGTGKERIARMIHRLSGLDGPFVSVLPDAAPTFTGPPGMLYVEAVHRLADPKALIESARAAGWRVAAGTRLAEPPGGLKWERLSLPPLRERPDDLRALATIYLDAHARRLGLPKRTFDRGMWALLHAHRWPGNSRELEMFVMQVLGRLDGPILRGASLPDEVRAALLPLALVQDEAEGFEEMARVRLLPVVNAYAPGGLTSLHGIVVASTERALIQLVLARTQGHRKAAATLLGLSRNTLNQRIESLGIGSVAHRARPEE